MYKLAQAGAKPSDLDQFVRSRSEMMYGDPDELHRIAKDPELMDTTLKAQGTGIDSRALSYASQLIPFLGPAALGYARGEDHPWQNAGKGLAGTAAQIPAGFGASYLGAMLAAILGKGKYMRPAALAAAGLTMPVVGGEAIHRLTTNGDR